MINVGVIGLGMMGLTHLDVYAKRSDVKVLAISDIKPDRLSGEARAGGNIEGQAQGGFDYGSARRYDDGMKLIADPEVDLVDVCLTTPMHVEYGLAALKAGKHLMVEKPLARNYADAMRLVEAAEKSSKLAMVGKCMRFWPGWTWLKEAIDRKTYGRCLSAHFRRVAAHPGGEFYLDGVANGGAVLDLHIHDTDFVNHCFGIPAAVSTVGYSRVTGRLDHVCTQYIFRDGPMVTAEGGWAMAAGFPFTMQYTANFEKATAVFDLAGEKPLLLYRDGKKEGVELAAGMGYEHELAYFIECIRKNERPSVVTLRSAAESLKIVEAEVESAGRGMVVEL